MNNVEIETIAGELKEALVEITERLPGLLLGACGLCPALEACSFCDVRGPAISARGLIKEIAAALKQSTSPAARQLGAELGLAGYLVATEEEIERRAERLKSPESA